MPLKAGWLGKKNIFFAEYHFQPHINETSYVNIPTLNKRLGQQLGKATNLINLPMDVTNKGMEDNMA
jgi:hypothetical protein